MPGPAAKRECWTRGDPLRGEWGYASVLLQIAENPPTRLALSLVSDMANEAEPGADSTPAFGADPRQAERGHPLSERGRVAAALFGRPAPEQKVGRYPVIGTLGEGAMGVVYEGFDEGLKRAVAIKLIRNDVWDGGHAEVRFRREAQALARLSHPNVVAVHEIGEYEGQLFIAMELVRGQSLRAWLALKPRSWRERNQVFIQAGRGLEAAHGAGLVHRDFKPANCLVGDDGRVRVLDFGLARSRDSHATADSNPAETPSAEVLEATLTATGALLGTPAYMAPEQLRSQSATAASDQFAFGVALYEALVGVRPFSGSSAQVLYENIKAGSIAQGRGSGGVPSGLLDIVRRSLNAEPDTRWPDMKAFVDALERFPVRQRRRRFGLAGGGLVSVGVVAALATSGEEPCADADSLSAPGWSAADRAGIKEAIGGHNADTEAVWKTADAAFGAWAEGWREARSSTCHAAMLEGRTTETIYDRQVACLDRHGRTAAALIGGLQTDTKAWLHVLDVVRLLPPLGPCSDPKHVLAVDPPDSSISESVDDVRAKIDASLSAWTRGEGTEARRLGEEAFAASASIDYPLLRAEAAVLRGTLLANALGGELEDVLLSAWSDAELAGDDLIAADAATLLLDTAVRSGQPLSAKRWLVLGEAKVARVGGDIPREAALALGAAELARMVGDAGGADEHSQRALELTEDAFGTEGFEYADALGYRALSLELSQSRPRARAAHDRAVKAARATAGLHPLLATALRNRGGFRLATADFEAAVKDFDHAISILENATLEEGALLKTRLLKLQAVSMTGDLDLKKIQQAMQPLERLPDDHPALLEAMELKATLVHRLGEFEDALSAYDSLIASARRQPETRNEDVAMLESNAAECLLALERLPRAQQRFELALRTLEETLEAEDVRFAYPLNGLGNVALRQGEAIRAHEFFERALPLAIGNEGDLVTLASVQWGLARALRLRDREPERAESLARDAAKNFRALKEEGRESLQRVESWLDVEPTTE